MVIEDMQKDSIEIITPRACARGKMIGYVVVVIVVDTKIAKSGDLGT